MSARAVVTVSETLVEREPGTGEARGRGLPGCTFKRAAGELWRSRSYERNNLVVINNGHRDYLSAAQKHPRGIPLTPARGCGDDPSHELPTRSRLPVAV